MRSLPERCDRLSILVLGTERHGKLPMYVEIVERARRAGLAGATVTAGLSEPGPVGRAQERNAASLLGDVPVEVTIIESPERLDGFLSQSGDLLEGVLVARNPVRVVRQRDRSSGGSRP